jgi:LmbE family N-acetylglucosaminyl deacetylase
MNYLIVVAHPDDEVLGAGATIKKLTERGNIVDICIMSSSANARAFRPKDNELSDDLEVSSKLLGIHKRFEGLFPNIEMNNVPHLQLVQFIEKAIIESNADVVITHHPSDTNNDHLQTSLACQEAIRLFQRRKEVKPLKEFLFMEVLSSTEWSVNTAFNKFRPNTFFEVEEG